MQTNNKIAWTSKDGLPMERTGRWAKGVHCSVGMEWNPFLGKNDMGAEHVESLWVELKKTDSSYILTSKY